MKSFKFSQVITAFFLAIALFASSLAPSLTLVAKASQTNNPTKIEEPKTVQEIDRYYNDTHNLQAADPKAIEKGVNRAEDLGDRVERAIGDTGLKNIKEIGKNIPETAKEVRNNFGLNR
jgi:hypothetical protein